MRRFDPDRYYRPRDPEFDTIVTHGRWSNGGTRGRGLEYTRLSTRILTWIPTNAQTDARVVESAA